VPAHLDPARAYPLVIVLHGLGGDAADGVHFFGLGELVDQEGFLLAFPEGNFETVHGHPMRYWNATDMCCAFFPNAPDDVTYLDAVIDDMGAHYRVENKRIYLVGLSNGGFMAHRYACDRAQRVAAIVSFAGAMWTDVSQCRPSEPVAVLEVHGDADRLVPYAGAVATDGRQGRTISAHETVADWVKLDGCAPAADTSDAPRDLVADERPSLGAETVSERWGGCRGVELWTVRGGAHVPRTRQPDFARTIWDWMARHPKP
jgi:polyhydroxybutyrate depolymerase